jgi:CRISPR-associated exonuclease Cas4
MSRFAEEDYLQISGIQHFCFCRRQWALIHIEQLWNDNLRTIEGEILHEQAHKEDFVEKRKDVLVTRGLRVFSPTLGVSGVCDVVEFFQSENGVPLHGRDGTWQPVPVEYKRGVSKQIDADRLQLCCQAMCLEEMLACEIPRGDLFYGETRRRETVPLTQELRSTVRSMLREMHGYYNRRYTPKEKPDKNCNACSLKELCLPKLYRVKSVKAYLETSLREVDASCENC